MHPIASRHKHLVVQIQIHSTRRGISAGALDASRHKHVGRHDASPARAFQPVFPGTPRSIETGHGRDEPACSGIRTPCLSPAGAYQPSRAGTISAPPFHPIPLAPVISCFPKDDTTRKALYSRSRWTDQHAAGYGSAFVPVFLSKGEARVGSGVGHARRWLAAAIGLGVMGMLIHIGLSGRAPEARAADAPNIIFLVLETVRADHVGAYGYPRDTLPVLEGLAREGLIAERALSAAPWTLPSVTSILSGLPPSAHGVLTYEDRISPKVEMLAERLKSSGYHTSFVGVNSLFEADRNVEQGFEHYYGTDEISGEELNERLREWLMNRPTDRPFFLYVHYFDPHCRYQPPAEYHQMYWPPPPGLATGRTISLEQFNKMHECFQLRWGSGEPVLNEDYYLAEYDAELRHVDHVAGLFLERLKTAGVYDKSLIVLLSDHGEEFYEHGGFGHGKVLYEELLHIPFFVKLPGSRRAGARIRAPVWTLDLYPTALSYAGLDIPPWLPGRDLRAVFEEGDEGVLNNRAVFAETSYEGRQQAVYQGAWKLLISPDGTRSNGLFNVKDDPREREDLSMRHPRLRAKMEGLIDAFEADAERTQARVGVEHRAIEADTLEELRALGYVQ